MPKFVFFSVPPETPAAPAVPATARVAEAHARYVQRYHIPMIVPDHLVITPPVGWVMWAHLILRVTLSNPFFITHPYYHTPCGVESFERGLSKGSTPLTEHHSRVPCAVCIMSTSLKIVSFSSLVL